MHDIDVIAEGIPLPKVGATYYNAKLKILGKGFIFLVWNSLFSFFPFIYHLSYCFLATIVRNHPCYVFIFLDNI